MGFLKFVWLSRCQVFSRKISFKSFYEYAISLNINNPKIPGTHFVQSCGALIIIIVF